MSRLDSLPGTQIIRRGGNARRPQHGLRTLLRLLRTVIHRPWQVAAALGLTAVSVAASVGGTYLLKPIFDRLADTLASGSAVLPAIAAPAGLTVLLCAAEAAAAYGQSTIMARLALNGCHRLRETLLRHVQQLPMSRLDGMPHGELMSRLINDADSVQQMLESGIVTLIQVCCTFCATLIMMLLLSWRMFLVTAAVCAVTALFFRRMGRRGGAQFRAQQAALARLNTAAQEYIRGIRTVRAFHREEETVREFDECNEQFRVHAARAMYLSSGILPIASNISNCGYALTAVLGCLLTAVGLLTAGDLVSYLTFTRKVTSPINSISQQFTGILSALASAERIFALLDLPTEEDGGHVTAVAAENGLCWRGGDTLAPVRGQVEFDRVSFSYAPERPVLRGVSFRADAGSHIALVGPTGAGKTSILNLLTRFYEPQAGRILLDGIELRDIENESLRGRFGVVLQQTHLFSGTVLDNIRFGDPRITDEQCIAAAKRVHAHGFISQLPQGYHTRISDEQGMISQGQRQLLSITRAIAADPEIVILDEATSSVDIQTEQLINEGIRQLLRHRTAFIVAHRLSTIRRADRILLIDDGRIAEEGTHEELLRAGGRYAALWQSGTDSADACEEPTQAHISAPRAQ